MFEKDPARKKFYSSKRWQRARRAYLESRSYTCERCGGFATIVHHRRHLDADTVNDASMSLSTSNFEALCVTCHNKEHFGGFGAVAEGYRFDPSGEIVPV